MLSESQLDAAVLQNIITPAQRGALIDLARGSDPVSPDESTDEALRLVGGGNDLFVTIGTLLFLAGAAFIATPMLGANSYGLYALMAAAIWGLAEIVTRQKRMRLSSTVLAVLFLGAIASIILLWLSGQIDMSAIESNPLAVLGIRKDIGWLSIASALIFMATAAAYFWRFRVPVIAALVALAATALAFTQTALWLYDGVLAGQVAIPTVDQIPDVLRGALYVPLICGLIVFAVAVSLDLHDRERRTIWSDCAFWLHVVSAPLLVHPLFIMATGQDVAFGAIKPGTDAVIGLSILIVVFTYVALVIDRRSLLVPTLAYFGSLGVANLVGSVATNAGVPPIALVLIAVGGLIILFGAGWQRIRSIVMRLTLPPKLQRRLPPVLV
jgi:hypothetical protein